MSWLGLTGILALGALATFACGDPNDPQPTIGSLSGTVHDADTDAPLEGVTLVVAGIQGQTGSDGGYDIDSIPAGTHQVLATMTGYVAQTLETEIRAGATTSLSVELVADPDPGPSPLTITTSTLPSATVDVPYEVSLQATGGTLPYEWVLVDDDPPQGVLTTLPPGLTVEVDGRIAGTPGFPAGVYPLRIQVSDAEGETASADLALEVEALGGLRITSLELTIGEAQQPYADTLTAEGGSPPYTFIWPWLHEIGGLTLDAATGVLSGSPGGPTGPNGEAVEAFVTVSDVVGATAIAWVRIGVRPAPLVILTDLPDGRIHQRYTIELMATGGMGGGGYWSVVSGSLPPGLSFSGGPGTLYGVTHLEGTPTAVGSYDFTLEVSDSTFLATRDYTVVIGDPLLTIVTSTLPDADVGVAYNVFLVREGGTGPYEWDLTSGSLPPGISLSAAGELNGTPTTAGDYSFEVRVRDAGDQSATALLALHVEP